MSDMQMALLTSSMTGHRRSQSYQYQIRVPSLMLGTKTASMSCDLLAGDDQHITHITRYNKPY